MISGKASAIAHPIQGLIKYHGLKDETLRVPYQDSISVCVAPTATHTTVEFSPDFEKIELKINGRDLEGREGERVMALVGTIREKKGVDTPYKVHSTNNFTSNIGLGASASGFAALAKASSDALEMGLTLKEVSTYARLGAGSASRAVTGAFSYWVAGSDHETSYSYQLASPQDLPLGIVMVVIPAFKQTENAHREAVTSPLYQARLDYAPGVLEEMVKAIEDRDIDKIGFLAERDTLNLHGVTMTGKNGHLYWQPETVQAMHAVRKMRKDGLLAYFSIDTGATLYVNTTVDQSPEVAERLAELGLKTEVGTVGGEVQATDDHLF